MGQDLKDRQLDESKNTDDNLEGLRHRAEDVFQDIEAHYRSIMTAMQEGILVQEAIEDRMRSLTQFPGHNPNPVIQVTPDGIIRYANMSSAALLQSWSCSVNQALPANINAYILQVLESGENLETEVQVDGRCLSLVISPYSDKQHINLYGLDVTDRKRAENACRESEENTRMLIESAPIGIVIVDDHGQIYMINKQALRMFGYSHADLLGASIGQLVPDGFRDIHAQQCVDYRSDPHERPMGAGMDLSARRKNGSTFPVEINLGFIPTNAGLLTMAFIVDVTQKQQIESQRENLMRMMVHDLRSPLSSMLTSLEYLRDITGEVLLGDPQKLLDIAVNSADKMLKLVNAILDVNRLKSGSMPLVRNVVDLPDIAGEVLDEVAALAIEKNLTLTMDMPSTLPPIDVDPSLIMRVIQNLMNNAIKFTPEGGIVHMKAWQYQDDSTCLYVSVQDTGPGIPEEIRGRLFEEFVTGLQTGRGSGLGLAFCKLALETHGQRIWVETEDGQGTTFTFTLPVAVEE
ncbi:MAG: PAS domain S-box protein [Anaerolineales bacterium]|nr:MAG: PAS domain S-box protein [Anaerolineales bacterium]